MFHQGDLRSVIAAYLHGRISNAVYSAVQAMCRVLMPHVNPRDIASAVHSEIDNELDALIAAIMRVIDK